jgi:hypothetical protein
MFGAEEPLMMRGVRWTCDPHQHPRVDEGPHDNRAVSEVVQEADMIE